MECDGAGDLTITDEFLLRFSAKILRLSIRLSRTGLSVDPLTSEMLSRVLCRAATLRSTAATCSSSADTTGTTGDPDPSRLANSTGVKYLQPSQNKRFLENKVKLLVSSVTRAVVVISVC